ncbi:C40 family peptidase [Cytobacillus depressus]|nr:C40 family peptidase [Cytobacillus depressus]
MKKKIVCTFIALCALLSFAVPNGQAQENTRASLVKISQDYLKTPYKYGGTTSAGFDCSGFVLFIFKKFDISLPRRSADQATAGKAVKKEDLQPGDIVYFKNTPKSNVSHSGIYIGSNKFISSTTSHGIRIDSLNDPYYWGKRYAGARRVLSE